MPDTSKPLVVREYEAAKAYVARLQEKRDRENAKIPLTERELGAWERRIAKAERTMYQRLAMVIIQRKAS